MLSSKSSHKRKQGSSGEPSRKDSSKTGTPHDTGDNYSTIYLTLFVFRGRPDMYYKRHVLIYFTSPEKPNFHKTVHAQRDTDASPWALDQIHSQVDWSLSINYLGHVNAGAVRVCKGEEMMPVNIVAATPVQGREHDSGWNCQNFLLEGLQEIANCGLQTQEWYESVAGELMDKLLDGAVG